MIKKAFTLIELLVVMAIIGAVLVFVIPMVGQQAVQGDRQVAFFNDLLQEHLKLAEEEGVPVQIIGFKGSVNLIKYDGKRVSIPDIKSVQTVKINGELTPGVEYHITVYPDGLTDHFVLETDKKQLIESLPLLMQVTKAKML